jgi:sigma-B regulation protein RsbU (phosphoserine phosphatase)
LTGTDVLLGVRHSAPRHTYTCLLPAGSTVLLHTDGLVERRGQDIDDGLGRLYRRLRTHRARSPQDLLSRAADISGQYDDITMLAVRIPRIAVPGTGVAPARVFDGREASSCERP